MVPEAELLPGTLDLLILKAVSLGAEHGYGVLLRIEQITGNALTIEQGALYPALYRMQQKGWIKADWRQTPKGQRARYYALTAAGRRALGDSESSFSRLIEAIGRVMKPA